MKFLVTTTYKYFIRRNRPQFIPIPLFHLSPRSLYPYNDSYVTQQLFPAHILVSTLVTWSTILCSLVMLTNCPVDFETTTTNPTKATVTPVSSEKKYNDNDYKLDWMLPCQTLIKVLCCSQCVLCVFGNKVNEYFRKTHVVLKELNAKPMRFCPTIIWHAFQLNRIWGVYGCRGPYLFLAYISWGSWL